MKVALTTLVAVVALAAVAFSVGAGAVLLRGPSDPPVAFRVPDLAFLVPGVERLVEWEAERDAAAAHQAQQTLLLGYNHGRNVGELPECVVDAYEEDAGHREDVPEWVGRAVLGRMTVTCGKSETPSRHQLTVLECGNPFDAYQVVYGKAYNERMLHLVRVSYDRGE